MMELNMTQKQIQTLSPQMMQAMEVLQMGTQELLEYIEEQTMENPVLERLEESSDHEAENADLRRRLDWLEAGDYQNRQYHREDSEGDDDPLRTYGVVDDEETLCEYLFDQLRTLHLELPMLEAAAFLVESLNSSGWLDEDVPTLAAELGCPEGRMEQALIIVQGLDPAGVAARDLRECLLLQLKRQKPKDQLAIRIVDQYLEALARSRYGVITRELGESAEAVRRACDHIRALDPRPGAAFGGSDAPAYINPDILVTAGPDGLEVTANDRYFPTLQISGYYLRMMKEEQGDAGLQDYLTDKVRQAKWVVRSIEQRRSTLLSCAECIVDIQQRFFLKGPGNLVPLTLADVAARLGIHESTVSRAVKDKYLQCSFGVFPLSEFFSRGLNTHSTGEGASPDAAKALLKKLVAEEDKRAPLSDQKLCQLMEEEGCRLSRRTVAKYRDELGIPSTAGRKEYK